ncbi:Acid sphingomyelinase-like phosphodiesterase 3a [Eumeta japonica]|uniref:Acid sphingomyelinase-like phosphodiesterase 3a n=1 Tax=Eumeta variegata TaxID=151549 RepID=A0A4C1ZGY8_EUMVA|nr:Acid sphingomyelinase-like phosphodiesterase 3a [Eumeta japonica]
MTWRLGVLSSPRRSRGGGEVRRRRGGASAAGGGELSPAANARLLHLIRGYSDVIAGQFYGHRHADTFRLVYRDGRPVSWAFLAPAVTPRGAGSTSNPGLRLYKFDSNTGKVLDYTQYYLDVANARSETHWAIEYNLTQYYGLREVSATSLDLLAERIRSSHDSLLFTK